MKKTRLFAALLAMAMTSALLCVAFLAPMRTAAAPADVRYETFDLLAIDEKAPEADGDDHPWYKDGVVVLVNNPSNEEIKLAAGDYRLRYLYILVFDSNGICVEIGNNLFAEDDPRAAEFPQHDVPVPAGGFAIFYYYNADTAPANAALNDFYTDLGGATLYNSTMKVSGKKYSAVIENKTVTIYFGADEGTTSDGSSAESSATDSAASSAEESTASSAEESTATSSAVVSSASSETSSAASAGTSSVADSSAAESSAAEDNGPNTGLIVGIVIAVVVVIAAVVAIVVVKKKKS